MEITLENIGKRYDADWIFREINATFKPNNVYGLIGFNGSGKSTLLQIISGFVTPTEGTIDFRSTNEVLVEDVYKSLSMAAPYMSLPTELTVEEAVLNHSNHKQLVASTHPKDLIDSIQLYNHRNKTLSKLSSGMRQRLALALAIHSNCLLLLLDEPCANLDSKWSEWFNRCLEEHKENKTVIISSNSQKVELENVTESLLNVSDFTP